MYEFFVLSFLVVLFRQVGFAMLFLGGAFFACWIMRFAKKKDFLLSAMAGKGVSPSHHSGKGTEEIGMESSSVGKGGRETQEEGGGKQATFKKAKREIAGPSDVPYRAESEST